MSSSISWSDLHGFLALCDPVDYEGYVGPAWTLAELVELFNQRMREGRLVIAYTGQEDSIWSFERLDEPSAAEAAWSYTYGLRTSTGKLHLVSYSALTMVAQFDDERLLGQRDEHLLAWEVEPGEYTITLRRLAGEVDLDADDDSGRAVVEVILTPGMGERPAQFPGTDELLS